MSKTTECYVVQCNYGHGWEDIDIIEKNKLHRATPNGPEISALNYARYVTSEANIHSAYIHPHRIITRRITTSDLS